MDYCWWAAQPAHQESTGQYIDDSAISARVKTRLLHDNVTEGFNISVESYKGSVLLSGFVNSKDVVDHAEKITGSDDGVTTVTNELQVK